MAFSSAVFVQQLAFALFCPAGLIPSKTFFRYQNEAGEDTYLYMFL